MQFYSIYITITVVQLVLLSGLHALRTEKPTISSKLSVYPNKADMGDVVTINCSNTDKPSREFSITIVGENITLHGRSRANNTFYEAKYTMNFTKDISFRCLVTSKEFKTTAFDNQVILSYVKSKDRGSTNTPLNSINIPPPPNSGNPSSPTHLNDAVTYGGVGVGVVVIVILFLFIYKANKKSIELKVTNLNYENLPEESIRSPPSFPTAKLEETYLSPLDCQESPYAVFKPNTETYAQPFVPSLEDLYSKPLRKGEKLDPNTLYSQVKPKYQRNQSPGDVCYAEIETKKIDLRGDKYVNVSDSSEYATVSLETYANLAADAKSLKKQKEQKEKDYANMFSDGPYCNSKAKAEDYAEPAYCQINRF